MKYDYLVVGSGLYGAVFAREAADRGKKVLVIDKRPNVAGNIYTEKVEGIHVHKYGAHIFHTNDTKVWKYITRFAEFNRFTNSPVANYRGELYSLPFNMYTFNKMWGVVTPEEAAAKIEEQKKEAERAISKKEEICGVTIVRMAHSKTATVADRLFEKDKQQNLLILSDDGEANYFGDGKLCKMLQGNVIGEQPAPWDANQTIPVYDNFGGWNGGAGLGDENGNAFWGGYPDHEKVLNYIVSYNREKQERTAAKIKAAKLAKNNSGR